MNYSQRLSHGRLSRSLSRCDAQSARVTRCRISACPEYRRRKGKHLLTLLKQHKSSLVERGQHDTTRRALDNSFDRRYRYVVSAHPADAPSGCLGVLGDARLCALLSAVFAVLTFDRNRSLFSHAVLVSSGSAEQVAARNSTVLLTAHFPMS
jgi:hypothetical protein